MKNQLQHPSNPAHVVRGGLPLLLIGLFIIPFTALTLFLTPTLAFAQHWTPEEQEIIDLNQQCWDAWAAEDLTEVQRICNEHPDSRGWFTVEAVPSIGWFEKNAERWSAAFHPRNDWVYWDIRPLSVRIFNDTALYHFWATSTFEDEKGELTTQRNRQLNIWQRIDGRWTWIGGMATPEGDTLQY